MRTITACLLLLLLASAQSGEARAEIEILEVGLRELLPRDGELIQEGQVSIEYIGLSLGRRVRANGKHIYVSDEPVGERGVIFRDGYIELNIGAHAEKEEKLGILKPTFAVDAAATVKVRLDDELRVGFEVVWHDLSGDNLGGELAVLFAKGKIKAKAEEFAGRLAQDISQKIRGELGGGQFRVQIEPGRIVVSDLRLGPSLRVLVHLEGIGDVHGDGNQFLGTRGENRRLEGFQIDLSPPVPGLGLRYMAHVQDLGDTPFVTDGQYVGTRKQSRRLEGFAIQLTGSLAKKYSVAYLAHLEGHGDTAWYRDGQFCGTRGIGLRIEAIRVRIEEK